MSRPAIRDHSPLSTSVALSVAALTGAAFGLRLVHLTRSEIWVDEAATWWFGRLAAEGRLEAALEPTPPLYYALIGLLMRVFGESDLVLRLPSVVFGAAAIPVVWKLGDVLFGRRPAWIAAILLTLHPVHVFFSREARVYPLLLLLALLTAWTLHRLLREEGGGRTRDAVFLAVLLTLACYSHFYGMFLIAACGAVLVVLAPDRRRTLVRGLIACSVAGLLFLPYLAASLPHLKNSGAAWSVEHLYRDLPEERRIGRVVEAQLLGAEYHIYARGLSEPAPPQLLRLAALLAQMVLIVAALLTLRDASSRRATAFLALFWILPLAIPWAINHQRAIFQTSRHDVYVLGFTCLTLALGLEALLRRTQGRAFGKAAVAALLLILTFAGGHRLAALHSLPEQSYHRDSGNYLAQTARPGDRIFATGIRRLITEHYALLAGADLEMSSFPASTDEHPGWTDVSALLLDEPALHAEGRATVAALGTERVFALLRPFRRTAGAVSDTWLVDRHLVENLAASGRVENRELSAPDLHIRVFDAPVASPAPIAPSDRPSEPSPPETSSP